MGDPSGNRLKKCVFGTSALGILILYGVSRSVLSKRRPIDCSTLHYRKSGEVKASI